MSRDYSKMSVEELEREIEDILKKQHRKDDLFRLAVMVGQMDLAKFIYHDRSHLPGARHGKNPSKAGETVAYGQALIQLLLLAKSRGLDFSKVFEHAVEHMKDDEYKERKPKNGGEIRGHPVSGGRVIGKAFVVSESNPLENAPEGSIIVVEHANPGIAESVTSAPAVVTDQGGRVCHLAIVARERGLPAVVGTGNATELIRTGDLIAVDATRGIVTVSNK